MSEEKEKKSLGKHFDDMMLTYSSTKLGLTDYDPNETYNSEEKKLGIKELGIAAALMIGVIAVAAILVLFVLT